MAISLKEFKFFAKISQAEIPPAKAVGLLVLTKNPPGNRVVSIPVNSEFHSSSGPTFIIAEGGELNESESFQSFLAIAKVGGVAGNITANQTWSTSVTGVIPTNPQPFSGGTVGVPEQAQAEGVVDLQPPPDSLLQKYLDIGKQNVLTKLGFGDDEDLPDKPAVDRSVYLFAQFYTENWTSQMRTTSWGGDSDLQKTKEERYRAAVWKAINQEVDNLLRPFVNVSAFMPAVPGGS